MVLLALPVLNILADQSVKATANLVVSRTITNSAGQNITGGEIAKGETFNLNYTITPNVVSIQDPITQQAVISNIKFQDILPANMEVVTLPSGFTNTGSKAEGYTVSANVGDIQYTLNSNNNYKPDFTSNENFRSGTYTFKISIRSTVAGNFTFEKAVLNYSDLHYQYDFGSSSTGSTLGIAGDYNIFAFNNANLQGNLTIKGSIAVGYDLSIVHATNGGGGHITKNVVVGNNFNFKAAGQTTIDGTVTYGKEIYYDTASEACATSKIPSEKCIKGTISKGNPLSFNQIENFWKVESKTLSTSPNKEATTSMNSDQLSLKATSTGYNVFNVSYDQISKAKGIVLDTPSDSTAIINILGTKINMSQWTDFKGKSAKKVLLNFPEATEVKFISGWSGNCSILAPYATVPATNGSLYGTLIVASLDLGSSGSGIDSNLESFTGTLPTPSPAVSAQQNFNSVSLKVTEPVDNTPRTLKIEGADTAAIGQNIPLTAVYSPLTDQGIQYTWTVKYKDQIVSGVLTNGAADKDKIFTAYNTGEYTVTVQVKSSSTADAPPTATKIINVRDLQIDGPDSVFVGKKKDYTLKMDNIPAGSTITWSLTGDSAKYATLIRATGDTNFTKYTLTAGSQPRDVVISVTAAGITATKTVKLVPYSLTGLQAVSEIEIAVGEQYNMNSLLYPIPSEIALQDILKDLSWSSSKTGYAAFDQPLTDPARRGIITGIQKGETLVTVSYTPPGSSTPITAQIKVKVLAQANGDRY